MAFFLLSYCIRIRIKAFYFLNTVLEMQKGLLFKSDHRFFCKNNIGILELFNILDKEVSSKGTMGYLGTILLVPLFYQFFRFADF